MKLNAFIERLAKKAGVDTTLLALPATINDVDIPDEIAGNVDKALMTVDAAKAHAEVRKAIRTEALNGVDSKVDELLEELGLADDAAAEIKGEKNSYEKVARLTRKVKELEGKKAGTTKNADKEALEKTIADLNQQIKASKETLTAKEKEYNDARENDLTNFDLHKRLLGKNYALPKEMDTDLKLTTAQSAINKQLQSKGFKIVRDAETGSLKIVNKEGLQAYSETNEPLQVDTFIDGALAQNKLLVVNDDHSQNSGGNNGQSGDQIITGGGKGNATTVAAIDQQMKDLGLGS